MSFLETGTVNRGDGYSENYAWRYDVDPVNAASLLRSAEIYAPQNPTSLPFILPPLYSTVLMHDPDLLQDRRAGSRPSNNVPNQLTKESLLEHGADGFLGCINRMGFTWVTVTIRLLATPFPKLVIGLVAQQLAELLDQPKLPNCSRSGRLVVREHRSKVRTRA